MTEEVQSLGLTWAYWEVIVSEKEQQGSDTRSKLYLYPLLQIGIGVLLILIISAISQSQDNPQTPGYASRSEGYLLAMWFGIISWILLSLFAAFGYLAAASIWRPRFLSLERRHRVWLNAILIVLPTSVVTLLVWWLQNLWSLLLLPVIAFAITYFFLSAASAYRRP